MCIPKANYIYFTDILYKWSECLPIYLFIHCCHYPTNILILVGSHSICMQVGRLLHIRIINGIYWWFINQTGIVFKLRILVTHKNFELLIFFLAIHWVVGYAARTKEFYRLKWTWIFRFYSVFSYPIRFVIQFSYISQGKHICL